MRCCSHISFLFCRPTGPGHRPSLPVFLRFSCCQDTTPPLSAGQKSLEFIVAIATWVICAGWAIFGTSVPTQSAVAPVAIFRGGPRHPFSRVRSIYETRFFSHNFFWRPSGFVVSDSTKPDGNGPALWSCWVPLNVFRCRIPAPIPAVKRCEKRRSGKGTCRCASDDKIKCTRTHGPRTA